MAFDWRLAYRLTGNTGMPQITGGLGGTQTGWPHRAVPRKLFGAALLVASHGPRYRHRDKSKESKIDSDVLPVLNCIQSPWRSAEQWRSKEKKTAGCLRVASFRLLPREIDKAGAAAQGSPREAEHRRKMGCLLMKRHACGQANISNSRSSATPSPDQYQSISHAQIKSFIVGLGAGRLISRYSR